jgi:hypothetical protein
MRRLLHIVTEAEDPFAAEIIKLQRALPDCEVEVVRLTGRESDYAALLDKIFAADSVQVW